MKDLKISRPFLVILTILVTCAATSRLNVPRVLLPFSSKQPVNFTLEVTDGGCYKWSASRPEAVKLYPVFSSSDEEVQGCSKKALVFAPLSVTHRVTAIVLAEDPGTGEILRCDVIVNRIDSLQIFMKTRELFIEDAPEEFAVRAYDDQGNEFSSLEGLAFRWTVDDHAQGAGKGSSESVLRWVRFADSSYDVSDSIAKLEKHGLQGHAILLEGLRTGSAKLSVRLSDEVFKSVGPAEVNVYVVANLLLEPAEIYLLPGAKVDFSLRQFRQGKAQDVPLPSSQYYLEVVDSNIGQMLSSGTSFQALNKGHTQVVLRDRNMKQEDGMHAPTANVYVVYPYNLELALLPHRQWSTVAGEKHAIIVELLDEEGHVIFPGDDVRLKVHTPKTYLVSEATANGTYHAGIPMEVGLHKVKASLRSLQLPDGTEVELKPALKTSADMEVFQSISVTPMVKVYAWDPITQPKYEQKFKGSGGSDTYVWSSSNSSLATVSQTGAAKIQGMGVVSIVAAVPKNPHIFGEAQVFVLPAFDIKFVNHSFEVEVGTSLLLAVRAHAQIPKSNELKLFNDCTMLPFKIELTDRKNFEYTEDRDMTPMSDSCAMVPILAKGIGSSKVMISYQIGDKILKDYVTIASYKRLKVVQPVNEKTILALGSSRTLVFEGGPLPWINKPSAHYRKLTLGNESVADVGSLFPIAKQTIRDLHQVPVVCKNLGETSVTLWVGNVATSTNPVPVQAFATVQVICAVPTAISITPRVKRPGSAPAPCPMDTATLRVATQCYEDLSLVVAVRDELGRRFDNFSSLAIEWTLSNNALATLELQDTVILEESIESGIPVLGKSYQVLHPQNQPGLLDVTVRLNGYRNKVLKHWHISPQEDFPLPDEDSELSYTLEMVLVQDVQLSPNQASVLNHPDNKVKIHVSQGSGAFHVDCTPQDVAQVRYNPQTSLLEIVPENDGILSVTMRDLCLSVKRTATAQIQVSGVTRVELTVRSKVELGQEIIATVAVLDGTGALLPFSALSLIQLTPQLASDIIQVKRLSESDSHGARFVVRGLVLGDTTLSFQAGPAHKKVQSAPVQIQVFPPLWLSPRNVTLLIGGSLQVEAHGGPQDARIEFGLAHERIASVSHMGLAKGVALGSTRLVAKAVGIDRNTGKLEIYSQDAAEIHVVFLAGVKIVAPILKIEQGAEMPLYANGLDIHQNPLVLGSMGPSYLYEWKVEPSLSMALLSPLYPSGLEATPSTHDFAVRFKATKPGIVSIKLRVQLNPEQRFVEDVIQIQVFERLQLINPNLENNCANAKVLLTPGTHFHLQTNRDSVSKLSFRAYPVNQTLVRLNNKGRIEAGTQTGHVSVLVTVEEEFGVVQKLLVLVEVEPIRYMILVPQPVLSLPSHQTLSVLPLDFTMVFRPSYFDQQGRAFHAVQSKLNFHSSRSDVLSLRLSSDNSSLIGKAVQPGIAVLQTWEGQLDSPGRVQDFVRVHVGDVIQPAAASVVVGDVICFTSPVLSVTGAVGRWYSSHENGLDVHTTNGGAVALETGSFSITYAIPKESQQTFTSVTISPMTEIKFLNEKHVRLTNARKTHFVVPVVISSQLETSKTSNLVGLNCSESGLEQVMSNRGLPFSCKASFTQDLDVKAPEIFEIHPHFNTKTGQYECVIESKGVESLAISQLRTDVILTANTITDLISSVKLPFRPAFYLHNTEVYLNNFQNTAYVVVSGIPSVLEELQASVSDASVMQVNQKSVPTPGLPGQSLAFTIRLDDSFWASSDRETPLFIALHSTVTGQHIQVPVKIKFASGAECPVATPRNGDWTSLLLAVADSYKDWAVTLLSLLGTVSALYIGYRAIWSSSYRATSQPVFASSLPVSPATVYQMAGDNSMLRRPYLWSVDNDMPPVSSFQPPQYSPGFTRICSPDSSPTKNRSSYH